MVMKSNRVLILLTFILAACQTAQLPIVESPTLVIIPTNSATLAPTHTLTPQPTFTVSVTPTPSLIPTETPRPDVAPTLPHSAVNFIYHGDREKPYVALTFDLC